MSIKLPRREWFTDKELAAEWNVDLSYVLHLIEAHKLETSCLVKEDGWAPMIVKDNEELNNLLYSGMMTPTYSTKEVISLEEVERFENMQREQTANISATSYLDPKHKFYSEELAAAVHTWIKLYGDGGKYLPNRGHKEQIKAALAGKGLSNTAIDRIATVVNPNKEGGAPSASVE